MRLILSQTHGGCVLPPGTHTEHQDIMHSKAECALHMQAERDTREREHAHAHTKCVCACTCLLSCVAVVRSETQYISTLSMQSFEGTCADADAASAKPVEGRAHCSLHVVCTGADGGRKGQKGPTCGYSRSTRSTARCPVVRLMMSANILRRLPCTVQKKSGERIWSTHV